MDFIKKHYEKLAVAVVLAILIGSAIVLAFRVSELSEEVNNFQQKPRPKVKTIQLTDTSHYSNAIASLVSPVLWQKRGNPFFTGAPIEPGPKTNIVMGQIDEPIAVGQILRQPFKLIFKSYTGDGHSFAINFLTRAKTFFIAEIGMEIADAFEKTGFVIKKFEHKTQEQDVPGVGKRQLDVSELTIQHPGDDPIVMPLNRVVEEKEPVAVAQCRDGMQQFQIHRGQDFDCGTNTYNVVDITSTQVIIVNKLTKEKHIIKPAGR